MTFSGRNQVNIIGWCLLQPLFHFSVIRSFICMHYAVAIDVLIIRLACLHVYRGRTVFRTPLEISLYFYGFNLKRVNSIQRVHCIALLTFKQRTGTHNSMTLCAFPRVLKQQNVNGAKGGGVRKSVLPRYFFWVLNTLFVSYVLFLTDIQSYWLIEWWKNMR